MKIILASQSAQRKKLFDALQIKYQVIPSHLDESSIKGQDISERVQKLAMAKARAVADQNPHSIVVASDSVAQIENQILEKPADLSQAKKMLLMLSDSEMKTVTGYCYIDQINNFSKSGTVVTKAKFRKLSESEIDNYIASEPVTTWSGGYSPAYDAGANLIEWVNGSLTAFTHGIPMEIIIPLLYQSRVFN